MSVAGSLISNYLFPEYKTRYKVISQLVVGYFFRSLITLRRFKILLTLGTWLSVTPYNFLLLSCSLLGLLRPIHI